MEVPTRDPKCWIPPIVRGMTFNGETGLVVTVRESTHVELTLPPINTDADLEQNILSWREAFTGFIMQHGRYPATVAVEREEWTLGIADSLDNASQGVGTNRDPSQQGSSARADIMQGKISLVTGGAQGFGEGFVKGLIQEGGFVYIADMNLDGAQQLAETLNREAKRRVAKGLYVNVTDEESVEKMMDEVAQLTGSLDLFVSNAGVLKAGSVKQMSLQDFQFVTSVDYTGFFICTKFAARQLALQNAGSGGRYLTDIVTVSSKSGLEGSNKNGAYAGAKFGTIGLAQSFALELVTDNIKVNAVCPGNFLDGPLWSDPENGLFVQYLRANKVPGAKSVEDVRRSYESKVPLNRGCRTEDVVRAICYIVEQKYETGQAVPVTGGQVMLN